MSIHLQRPRYDLTLISTSELSRLLNVPESRMLRAIREDIICPIGVIGRATLIAMTDDEREAWPRATALH